MMVVGWLAGGFLSFFLFSLPLLVLCSISTMKLSMNALYFCFAGLVRLFSCRFCLILRVCYFSHLSLLFRSFGRPVVRSFGRSVVRSPLLGRIGRNEAGRTGTRCDETRRVGTGRWFGFRLLFWSGWAGNVLGAWHCPFIPFFSRFCRLLACLGLSLSFFSVY